MSNFFKRAITGILFVVIMVAAIWYSYWSMASLFLTISVLGLWEFYSLLEKANYAPQKYTGVTIGSAFVGTFFLMFHDVVLRNDLKYLFFLFSVALICVFFLELFRKKEAPFTNIALTILGIIYIPSCFLFITTGTIPAEINQPVDFFASEHFPNIIIGYFFLVWSNDTFAYLVGMTVGKNKLFERISPKKTWEGTIGGSILTMIVGYVISIYFTEIAPIHWIIMALIISITATLGDLVESMFKRSLNVKDSGSILPGHGGILDRFDGVLLSSPFVFTYLLLIH